MSHPACPTLADTMRRIAMAFALLALPGAPGCAPAVEGLPRSGADASVADLPPTAPPLDSDAPGPVDDGAPGTLDASERLDVPSDVVGEDAPAAADVLPDAGAPDVALRALDPYERRLAALFRPVIVANFSAFAGNAASLGYRCLTAAAALRRAQAGAPFSATLQTRLAQTVRAAADVTVAIVPRWNNRGWGLSTTFDAFGDGTTNPTTAVYAFQTGLALWCLEEAAQATGTVRYHDFAVATLDVYRRAAYADASSRYRQVCPGCGTWWYSLEAADRGRYVKNTSIEMGVASLVSAHFRPDAGLTAIGTATALTQYEEIHGRANYTYFGALDRAFATAPSWDHHNSAETYLLLHAGNLLRRQALVDTALTHYRAYVPHGSTAEVAYAACHFARIDAAARAVCFDWLDGAPAENVDPALYGLMLDY